MQSTAIPRREEKTDIVGLSSSEVRERKVRGKSNDFEARVGRSYWDIFRDNVLNLFNIVLGSLLVGVIALGDYATAFFAGFSVVSNTFFGMIQEFNAKRQLDRLAAMAEQTVRCRRDGGWVEVPMRGWLSTRSSALSRATGWSWMAPSYKPIRWRWMSRT